MKTLIALIVVAAIALVVVGQESVIGIWRSDEACGTIMVNDPRRNVTHYFCGDMVGVRGLSIEAVGAPQYIVRINNIDAIDAIYVEGREISLAPLDPFAVFIAGIALGGLLAWMLL